MCGIAGFSMTPHSRLERTLVAQALLAAIAERGGDAVGYAYREPRAAGPAVVIKQRTPASKLLEQVEVPDTATELLVHVRDFTKGHPSIAANNHPVRHGPVVGVQQCLEPATEFGVTAALALQVGGPRGQVGKLRRGQE